MEVFEHLHMHSMDRFDSMNAPTAVCKKLKELGFTACVLTQHGIAAAMEEMKAAAKQYGLKFIPGIETYYMSRNGKKCHAVLISADITGWLSIAKAITKSQDKEGYSVMTEETFREYFGEGSKGHGHVFFLSACTRGILGSILLENEASKNEAEKLVRKYEKLVPEETSEKLKEALKETERIQKKILECENDLSEHKNPVTDAEKAYKESVKARKKDLSRQLTAANRIVRSCEDILSRGKSLLTEIDELRSGLQSDDELLLKCEKEMHNISEIFGEDHFFVEIQYHGMEEERVVYPKLVKLARKNGYPLVATNDCHIIENTEEELLRRNTLRALRFGTWEDVSDSDRELYIKSSDEMKAFMSKIFAPDVIEEAMGNTGKIVDRCNVEFPKESHYPVFPCENGRTAEEVFDEEIAKGIQWRFPNGFSEEYRKRLEYENSVIKKMGYVNYHLIVKDFLEYGRALSCVPAERSAEAPLTIAELKTWTEENHWTGGFTIGPGRGSAVGSLVCYLLGITSLDPLKYSLLFERFLNVERVSMPDIDSDIAKGIRSKVIEYIANKYGENAVCGIITTNALAPKGCIRTAAKYYAISRGEESTMYLSLAGKIAKAVPSEVGTKFETVFDDETGETVFEMLLREFDFPEAGEILRWAKSLEGSFTAYGAHAAGIVISDNDDISDYMPLRWNEKLGEYTTQCNMVSVEENGYLKMDCLGLKTLDIITDCLRMIREKTGENIDVLKLDTEDENVYRNIFQNGRTNSVFQFESDGMKNMLKRFKPTTFEDLIILVSMFRPGPLQYIDQVIDVKQGTAPATYLTPELEPILGKTYAAIVYQGVTCSHLKRMS